MRLQSKVYEPTTTYTLALFVNVNTFANPVLGVNMPLFELVVAAAASVTAWATEAGFAVGLFSNGVQAMGEADEGVRSDGADRLAETRRAMRVRLPPTSRPEQLPRVLEALARLIPYFGSPLDEVLSAEQSRLPVGSSIILVSAAAAVTPALVATLVQARRRGHAVALLLSGDEPVEALGLPGYRLGKEEVWHEIMAQAAKQEYPQAVEAGWRFFSGLKTRPCPAGRWQSKP